MASWLSMCLFRPHIISQVTPSHLERQCVPVTICEGTRQGAPASSRRRDPRECKSESEDDTLGAFVKIVFEIPKGRGPRVTAKLQRNANASLQHTTSLESSV